MSSTNLESEKELLQQIQSIIAKAKERAIRSVDSERVIMYWQIGKVILEEEQQGKERANYGEFLIKSLAQSLEPQFGSGFSIRQLEMCRQFYRTFPIANALRSQFSWTHYRTLIRIDNQDKRDFLLEIGNGFSFVARQKRIHLEGDEFYVDLVFYNRLLLSFVICEIKTTKLTHEDIGQLQMYVNYYDRFEKQDFENPTIGILLCADKNDAVVKITLPENNKTIIASKYQLYLPSEQQLMDEVKKEIGKLDNEDTNTPVQ